MDIHNLVAAGLGSRTAHGFPGFLFLGFFMTGSGRLGICIYIHIIVLVFILGRIPHFLKAVYQTHIRFLLYNKIPVYNRGTV